MPSDKTDTTKFTFDDQADAAEAAVRVLGGKQDEWRLVSQDALESAALTLRALARSAAAKRERKE